MEISTEMVKQSVRVVKELEKHTEKKKDLLTQDEDVPIFLQVSLKKFLQVKSFKLIKIVIPHPLINDTSEVCLFTKDLDKADYKGDTEPTVEYYKEILKSHDVTRVTQVIPLRQLRREYNTYQTLRKLLQGYDRFLMDRRIATIVGPLLGQQFVSRRKFPLQVDLMASNLKEQIDEALNSAAFFVTNRGDTFCSEVATIGMEDEAIQENVMTVVKRLESKLEICGGFTGLYLKTLNEKAIPFYISFITNETEIEKEEEKMMLQKNAEENSENVIDVDSEANLLSNKNIKSCLKKKNKKVKLEISEDEKIPCIKDNANNSGRKEKLIKSEEQKIIIPRSSKRIKTANVKTEKLDLTASPFKTSLVEMSKCLPKTEKNDESQLVQDESMKVNKKRKSIKQAKVLDKPEVRFNLPRNASKMSKRLKTSNST